MFELKILESDDSEDTARAAHARVFRWAVHAGTFVAIWATFNVIGTGALSRRGSVDHVRLNDRLPPGAHAWCDHVSGRCGIHNARHRPIRVLLP